MLADSITHPNANLNSDEILVHAAWDRIDRHLTSTINGSDYVEYDFNEDVTFLAGLSLSDRVLELMIDLGQERLCSLFLCDSCDFFALVDQIVSLNSVVNNLCSGSHFQPNSRTLTMKLWMQTLRFQFHQALHRPDSLILSELGNLLKELLSNRAQMMMHSNSLEPFYSIFERLCELNLFDVCRPHLLVILEDIVKADIASHCSGTFDLESSRSGCFERVSPSALEPIDSDLAAGLTRLINTQYFESRVTELFDMIQDYPDSVPAWMDMATCMGEVDGGRGIVLSSLNQAISHRLLHFGASTVTILKNYCALIKCLEILDSSGYIMNSVSPIICQYLRKRADIKHYIVYLLMGEKVGDDDSSFSEYLSPSDSDDFQCDETAEWEPAAIDSELSLLKSKTTFNVVIRLIGIFEKVDDLIAEFEKILCGQLISANSYDVEQEVAWLETMKARLGEDKLSRCDVMLKDIVDSRRVAPLVLAESAESSASISKIDNRLDVVNLSYLMWPEIPRPRSILHLPAWVREQMTAYETSHKTLKPSQSLFWQHHIGTVELEIEDEAGTLKSFCVTPLEATVLLYIQEQGENDVSVDNLMNAIQVDRSSALIGLSIWVREGIIEERRRFIFCISQGSSSRRALSLNELVGIEGVLEAPVSTASSMESTMMANFILGMLTNQGAANIDVLHRMICMLVPNSQGKSKDDVKVVLNAMISEGKISLSNGLYTVKK